MNIKLTKRIFKHLVPNRIFVEMNEYCLAQVPANFHYHYICLRKTVAMSRLFLRSIPSCIMVFW